MLQNFRQHSKAAKYPHVVGSELDTSTNFGDALDSFEDNGGVTGTFEAYSSSQASDASAYNNDLEFPDRCAGIVFPVIFVVLHDDL